jgi:acyl-CoA thioesterase FadM
MTDHVSQQDKVGLHLASYYHRHSIETRSSDSIGSNGHVPNGRIAEYADDARLDMHRIILGEDNPVGFKLAEARFQYLAELTYPGPVTVGVGIVGIGNSSVRQIAGFFRDGRCLVLAHFTLVKAVNGESTPLTDRERLRAAPFVIATSDTNP